MGSLFALVFLLFGLVISLGWIVLLVWGIVRMHRQDKQIGLIMTVIGGLWGLAVVAIGIVAGIGIHQAIQAARPKTFNPAAYKGPVGTISLGYAGNADMNARLVKDNKYWRFSFVNGVAKAPAGVYRVRSIDLMAPGKENMAWSAYISPLPDDTELTVKAGSQATFKAGSPFTAQVSIDRVEGDKASFSLVVTDCCNHTAAFRNLEKKDIAGFQVLSKSGQILWKGQFQPG